MKAELKVLLIGLVLVSAGSGLLDKPGFETLGGVVLVLGAATLVAIPFIAEEIR